MARLTQRKLLSLVAILTLIWGTNWVLFPMAVEEVSVWTFRSICVLGAGGLLLVFARMRGVSLFVPGNERRPLALAGLTYLAVWNAASVYAAVLLPSGQAAMIGFSMPVWASLLAWLVLGQRPTARVFVSLLLATLGIGLLAYAGRHAFASAPLGFALGLTGAFGWAIGTTILKRSRVTVPPLVATAWQLVIAGIPLTIIALATGTRELFMPTWTSIAVIGYVTIFSMAVGNVAWFQILDVLPPTISGLAIVMVPIVAMVTGALVRSEPLGALQVSAMVCCAAAMALVLLNRTATAPG
ncbi:MAG TPA: EamA family transporter [Ramlibacter sp.]|uniref:DMT family transporter n=1 Tax=Ramlibacter sp. TaxID=1917967 RepID=UPI002CE0A7D0|nr:EamA family transporter [Ramlibacter sp.]HVZ45949.1 EamA family transporter [Ramlibacter sp.]